MNNQRSLNLSLKLESIIQWGSERLISHGYTIEHPPTIVVTTPWSNVIRLSTTKGHFYLKNTPSATFLSNEPQVIQVLSKEFHANVPLILNRSEELHCFICGMQGR